MTVYVTRWSGGPVGWLGLRALRRPRSAGPQGKVPHPEGGRAQDGPGTERSQPRPGWQSSRGVGTIGHRSEAQGGIAGVQSRGVDSVTLMGHFQLTIF